MESKNENDGPFNGLLIDFGECLDDDSENGYKFMETDNFSAENAISEVFGGFFDPPAVAELPVYRNAELDPLFNSFNHPLEQKQSPYKDATLATLYGVPPPSLNQPPPTSAVTPPFSSGFGANIETTAYGFGGPATASPNPVHPKEFWAIPKNPENGTTSGFDDKNNNNKFPMEAGVRHSGFGRSNDDIALLARRNNRSRVGGRGSSVQGRGLRRSDIRVSRTEEIPWRPSEVTAPKPTPLLETTLKQPVDQWLGCGMPARSPSQQQTFGPTSSSRETPKKRNTCQKCERCARYGHHADECYSTSHADTVRCYNCHDLGHLAARCPKPQRCPRRERERARTSVSAISGGTSSTTDGGSQATASDSTLDFGPPRARRAMSDIMPTSTSVGLIVKLMQDPFLRKEALRITPDAYDKMVKIMVEHVQL